MSVFPGSTKGGGQSVAFPDVCKVPAPPAPFVPVPFPNIGMQNQSGDESSKVSFDDKKVLMSGKSGDSRSSGDEAGTLKGMVSSMNMSANKCKTGSGKVKIEGAGCQRHLSNLGQNGSNANHPMGTQVAPSQTSVRVAP